MKKIRTAFLIIAALSLIAGRIFMPEEKIDEKRHLSEIAPGSSFSDKKGDPPRYQADSGSIAFNTYDLVPHIRGYAGPIRLLLALDYKGKITGIRILSHRETKNYVHYVEGPQYLKQFIGKGVNDPFRAGEDIEAVSRATVSVEALAETVRESTRKAASEVYGLRVEGAEGAKRADTGWVVYLSLFIPAYALYSVTRRPKRLLRSRDISLVLGIVIIGVYLATPFSILHVFNTTLLRLSSSLLLYVIAISTMLSIMFGGRFYCGWLCPFGALAEFIGRLPFRKWDIPVETDDRWRRLKYFLLILITAVALAGAPVEYVNYETYVTLFSFHGNTLTWLLVILMLVINIRVERFWCRYLCPVGALAGLFSRKDGGYTGRKDCPMSNKPSPHISECVRCNRCYKL
ncbi:MAG: 4Fe-4S binding protein [Nitrospirae bacterium]|nr:4Fe-4S binding protein [Nitrospirota bacterium]